MQIVLSFKNSAGSYLKFARSASEIKTLKVLSGKGFQKLSVVFFLSPLDTCVPTTLEQTVIVLPSYFATLSSGTVCENEVCEKQMVVINKSNFFILFEFYFGLNFSLDI